MGSRAATIVIAMSLVLLPSTEALAQLPIPTELSIGIGAVLDGRPSQVSPILGVDLAFVYVRNQWLEPVVEFGFGPTSDVAPCQNASTSGDLSTCTDGYVVGGARFRPVRDANRSRRPFVHLLAGGYLKGTGLAEPEFQPGAFALQAGGGIDLRRSTSIHGLRLSGDYRHVFAGTESRHQMQFTASYFLGARGQ